MLTDARSRRIAVGSAGLAVVVLAVTVATIASYEPPNDGGTSLTGVAFGIALFVCIVGLMAPALLAVHLRWGGPAPLARWGFVSGSVAGTVAALSFLIMVAIERFREELPPVLRVEDALFVPLFLATLVAIGGVVFGFVGQLASRARS